MSCSHNEATMSLCREWAKQNKTKNSLRQEKTEYCIKTNIKTDDKAMYKK